MARTKVNRYNQVLGRAGEDYAVEFLAERGFEILARNYRCGRNEIDLIAKRGNIISFVEVKTRRTAAFGHPTAAITTSKQREIAKAAECYIHAAHHPDALYRFDVVAISFANGIPTIEFIEDAFRIF